MKEIKLTRGLVALVDDEDYRELNQYKWFADPTKKTYYAKRTVRKNKDKRQSIYMHRQILGEITKGFMTDHIDSNGLNNQKLNLRVVNNRENCYYKSTATSSIYPGVCWDKSNKRWRASIRINKVRKQLGSFIDEKEAAQAYQDAVIEIENPCLTPIKRDELTSLLTAIKQKLKGDSNYGKTL